MDSIEHQRVLKLILGELEYIHLTQTSPAVLCPHMASYGYDYVSDRSGNNLFIYFTKDGHTSLEFEYDTWNGGCRGYINRHC